MSQLFEKAVAQNASQQEQFELKSLYEEFICEGRSQSVPKTTQSKFEHIRTAH